jgi:rubrerythrin
MSNLKGSQTEKNLVTAFAGESQARNRYSYFSQQAKKEGFVQIANIFEQTAEQERTHAKRIFKFLEGGEVEIVAAFPAGIIGTTLENLEASAAGENYEYTEMYPHFSSVASSEGFINIAAVFSAIAVAEQQHEKQYLKFMANIKSGLVFKKSAEVTWYCTKCGYIHKGPEAPLICSACNHPQSYYQLLAENW